MIAVSDRLFNGRARFRAAFGTFDSLAKTLVIGVEIEEEVFRINAIAWLVRLQNRFKEPRRVADVPTSRTHEFGRLNDVVLDLERRHDLHSPRANLRVEI